MMPLSPQLTDRIVAHVAAAGLPDDLATDLTDHLCCLAEELVRAGSAPDVATNEIISSWPRPRLRRLRRRVFTTLHLRPMLLKLSTAAALTAGFLLLSPRPTPEVLAEPCTQPSADYALALPAFDPPTASPLPGVDMEAALTSGFGMRMHPFRKVEMLHRGIDLKAPAGTPVTATAAGTVVFSANDGDNGLTVVLAHPDGYRTAYKHLGELGVRSGEAVELGDVIGEVGSTGAATGPHLHYEVLRGDVPVDPLALLD